VYQIHWDVSINALFFNGEGNFFPQKILFLQHNAILNRKFNFFAENIEASKTVINVSEIYSVGINDLVSKLLKKVSPPILYIF
jgi:hypothetical protein